MWEGPPQTDAGEVRTTAISKDPVMLSPTIVSALVAMREADLRHEAEVARRRRLEPGPEAPVPPTPRRRTRTARRRRHLRLV
jgi:hypothetical protein